MLAVVKDLFLNSIPEKQATAKTAFPLQLVNHMFVMCIVHLSVVGEFTR